MYIYETKHNKLLKNNQNTECICLVCERNARSAFIWTRRPYVWCCDCSNVCTFQKAEHCGVIHSKQRVCWLPLPLPPIREGRHEIHTHLKSRYMPATIFWKIMTSFTCAQAIIMANWLMLKSIRLATMG